jgi:hypothetical protein
MEECWRGKRCPFEKKAAKTWVVSGQLLTTPAAQTQKKFLRAFFKKRLF